MTEDASAPHGIQVKARMRCRTGCLTCRRRKKKCDETHPACAACQRNNIECQWESSASLLIPRRRSPRSRLAENILPEEAREMVNVFTVLKPDMITRLLGHFLNASPRWLSTRTGSRRTDYLKWLSPAVSDSPLVLDCILTIASADLLKYHRDDLELRHVAVEYYGQAVSGLRVAIESEIAASPLDKSLTDYNPLAVLLLCLHETQNFTDSERILPHLNAAVFLLQNRISRGSANSILLSFVFEMFCYFFALAAFSLGPKLLIYQAYFIFNSPSVIGHIQHGNIMGTSQHLFIIIFRVSSLAQRLNSKKPDEASLARAELLLLDQELASSQNDFNAKQRMDIGYLNDTITSELYRLACQIHVKKLLDPSTPDGDSTIPSLVESFVHQLQRLPLNSPSHSILSWPLVVAGCFATINLHQQIIAEKLVQIYDEWRSDIFSKSAAFLRGKWKRDRELKRGLPSRLSTDTSPVIWCKFPVILA